ncbi:hypothetical protein [Cytobacillus kochii]|uniref:Uncharacterized protein n=1 Tax=Cytobacillus kochii TaxID=859143 RepID=A0A248TGG4_9BACI|nr:hypothetical protein [Cytobacillus kochii]ASV67212.1 hypothetical protein CKF48_07645 [Cytobacillus kochii]
MTPEQLEGKLEKSLERFNLEMQSYRDTFNQTHKEDVLIKEDLDYLYKHTYYTLNDFKNEIIEYIKKNNQ